MDILLPYYGLISALMGVVSGICTALGIEKKNGWFLGVAVAMGLGSIQVMIGLAIVEFQPLLALIPK
jgi:hypothetical protein